jgi:membrane protein
MNAKPLPAILKETAQSWVQDNAMRLSAALSLYTILSLAPLLVITLKIVSMVWRNAQAVRAQMLAQMSDLMGYQTADAIQAMLDNGSRQGNGRTAAIVSTTVLIFSATCVFAELQDSMNTIWGVKPKPNQGVRSFVRNRLLSMAMVFGIAFLLLVSMFVTSFLKTLTQSIAGNATWIAFVGDFVLSLGVITLLFAAIFKFLPDVTIEWRHVWRGAALTAGLFIIGKYGLGLYFKFAAPTSAFGAAGSLAAVLLWVYYSSFILFFGAEFTKVWALDHARRIMPAENAVVTEEDRAQRGIPSKKRLDAALTGRPFDRDRPATNGSPGRGPGRALLPLGIGAFVGGLGAGFLAARKRRELQASILSARLHDRLHKIEDALDRRSLQLAGLKYVGVQQRIADVEKRIRQAARV